MMEETSEILKNIRNEIVMDYQEKQKTLGKEIIAMEKQQEAENEEKFTQLMIDNAISQEKKNEVCGALTSIKENIEKFIQERSDVLEESTLKILNSKIQRIEAALEELSLSKDYTQNQLFNTEIKIQNHLNFIIQAEKMVKVVWEDDRENFIETINKYKIQLDKKIKKIIDVFFPEKDNQTILEKKNELNDLSNKAKNLLMITDKIEGKEKKIISDFKPFSDFFKQFYTNPEISNRLSTNNIDTLSTFLKNRNPNFSKDNPSYDSLFSKIREISNENFLEKLATHPAFFNAINEPREAQNIMKENKCQKNWILFRKSSAEGMITITICTEGNPEEKNQKFVHQRIQLKNLNLDTIVENFDDIIKAYEKNGYTILQKKEHTLTSDSNPEDERKNTGEYYCS